MRQTLLDVLHSENPKDRPLLIRFQAVVAPVVNGR
jgi:hypothetical protein